MANLLNSPDLWNITGGDFTGGVWHLNIDGAHSERPNGNLTTIDGPGTGNIVAGTVVYDVSDYDSFLDSLYFVVFVSGTYGFSQLIYSPGDALPKAGSFDFECSTDGGDYVSIGMGRDPISDPAVNVTDQYISIGSYSITPKPDPEPPQIVKPRIIERTYTASTSADTSLETWIRGEEGRIDLSGVALEALVRPYSGRCPAVTLAAAGDASGLVQWSVSADQARRLGAGLYRVVIRRADRGQLLHRGTLEVQF